MMLFKKIKTLLTWLLCNLRFFKDNLTNYSLSLKPAYFCKSAILIV